MSISEKLPGIDSENSRWRNWLVGFAYVFLALMVIGAAAPAEDTGDDTTAEINDGGESETDAGGDSGSPDSSDSGSSDSDGSDSSDSDGSDTGSSDSGSSDSDSGSDTEQVDQPEPQSDSGSGAGVSDTFTTEGGLVVFELDHGGSSNFIVELTGDQEDYLVNTIGAYDGRVAMYLPAGEYRLDVDADGDWSATVRQPRWADAEAASPPVDAEGTNHDYIGPIEFAGGEVVTIEAQSDEHMAVWLADHHGRDLELLANDIGPYEQQTVVSESGYGLIRVETTGDWRIEIKE